MITFKTILVVAAHPDDEVLGCGGTLARLAREGSRIHVAFLADGVGARHRSTQPPDATADPVEREPRRASARKAADILGIQSVSFDDFPDNRMDVVPLLEIVQTIERFITRHNPDTVFTHHAGDVNVDHRRIHEAITAACRPQPGHCVRNILCFEVASSTEWQLPGSYPAFMPNMFVALGAADIDKKRRALAEYATELRKAPHSRSAESVDLRMHSRGSDIGVDAAEAFVLQRARVTLAESES